MDFDIGNLVYIILTLIFLIVGALGKKKKPDQQVYDSYDEEQAGEEKPLNNLEQRFNELFEDDDEEIMVDESRVRETESVRDEKPDYLLDTPYEKIDDLPPEYNKVLGEKEEKKLYKMEDHIEEIARDTKLQMAVGRKRDVSFVQKALKDFSPKKAYLYSEIFKPKYF